MERSGEQDVGTILPRKYTSDLTLCDEDKDLEKELMQTIIFTKNDSSTGLIVERITGIVEESITLLRGANRKGSNINPCCAR
jgi:hypothetical protein